MHSAAELPAIIAKLRLTTYKQVCYRIVGFAALTSLDPMMPLYALGPGIDGQRYTPRSGPSAVYLAEDIVTAEAEYHRVDRVVLVSDPTYHLTADPTVRLTVQVDLERVLDLTDADIQAALDTTTAELTGPWRKQMIKKMFCPTHVLAAAVYGHGSVQAMRYPSARAPGNANLIIWDARVTLPSTITVIDSTGTLSARIPPKRRYKKGPS